MWIQLIIFGFASCSLLTATGGVTVTYTSQGGRIISPNFPEAYPNDVDLEWSVEPDSRLSMLFVQRLEMKDSNDYLEVRAGRDGELLANLTGSALPQHFTAREFYLHFITGSGADDNQDTNNRTVVGWTVYWRNALNIREYRSSYGVLTSPNFPDYYNNMADVFYWIHPRHRQLRLTITDFQTESHWDYLEIFEGQTGPLLANLSGNVRTPMTLAATQFFLHFKTGAAYTLHGWSLNWGSAFAMRLVGGSDDTEGRVEIQNAGSWYSVCDSWWDMTTATIVCEMLGYGAGTPTTHSFFGYDNTSYMLDHIRCPSDAIDLSFCQHGFIPHTFCGLDRTAGARCSNIRLNDGSSGTFEGRVEVFHNEQWGTVCDDGWDDGVATLTCKQLGYSGGIPKGNAFFGAGSGDVYRLEENGCQGNQSRLEDCLRDPRSDSICTHAEDAGVICNSPVRLMGGPTPLEGRVEVLYNDEWGTICGDRWAEPAARVVCRSLGLAGGEPVLDASRYFGDAGNATIWLDEVQCEGEESSIIMCPHRRFGNNGCTHGQDAGVRCEPKEDQSLAAVVSVRLVGGYFPWAGRVEVNWNGTRGTVCDDGFDDRAAHVVCSMLGYRGGRKTVNIGGNYDIPVLIDDVRCRGTESNICFCGSKELGNNNCGHFEDVAVECDPAGFHTTPSVDQFDIRLVDGHTRASGRVEVHYAGEWGTVCDDVWTEENAQVVCRSLGFIGGQAHTRNFYGASNLTKIWMGSVRCLGNETSLADCSHNGFGIHNCFNGHEAGVTCVNGENTTPFVVSDFDIRLGLTDVANAGRVEVFHDGVWGTICNDRWDIRDATVVCRMLGFAPPNGTEGIYTTAYSLTAEVWRIWLDEVNCIGNESSILECPFREWGIHDCSHYMDAGVRCGDEVVTPSPTPEPTTPAYNAFEEYISAFGTILSPEFPGNYPNNVRKDYYIHPGPGIYSLVINSFILESFYDYVVVKEGGPNGTVLERLSGWVEPGTKISGRDFYIELYTDGSVGRPGFNISWFGEELLEKAVEVTCLRDGMDVRVNMTMLQDIYPNTDPDHIQIGDACIGSMSEGFLIFYFCYDCCFTTRQKYGTTLSFNNFVSYNDGPKGQTVIRDDLWKLGFQCDIKNNETSSATINPTDDNSHNVISSGNLKPFIDFYTDSTYVTVLSANPLYAREGESVYVKVAIAEVQGTKMVVRRCYSVPEYVPNWPQEHTLVNSGCAVDPSVNITRVTNSEFRFEFSVFRFTHYYGTVSVQCDVNFCDQGFNVGPCHTGCNRKRLGQGKILDVQRRK